MTSALRPDAPLARPAVSIIICTRNRAVSLARTLQAMMALDLSGVPGLELVVIDNGSADETPRVLAEAAARAPFAIHPVQEMRPGLSVARNRGLGVATGALIMLTDDDCLVAPDWVQAAWRLFDGNLRQMAGGRVELANPAHLDVTTKTLLQAETLAHPGAVFGFLMGANMMFGRAVVDAIGGFDVRLGAGTPLHSAEDIDYAYRASVAGFPVLYRPELLVHHDHGRTGADERSRLIWGYMVGNGALVTKHALAGRTDLVRPVYWDVRSAMRRWAADRHLWRGVAAKGAYAVGAWRYAAGAVIGRIRRRA